VAEDSCSDEDWGRMELCLITIGESLADDGFVLLSFKCNLNASIGIRNKLIKKIWCILFGRNVLS
jgi:hypothetical protein